MTPTELQYTREHEWIRLDGDTVFIGITDHAQAALGDIVYVELPKPGAALTAGKPFATIESVKAVAEVFAPLDGVVDSVNEDLDSAPELLNESPYDHWIVAVKAVSLDAVSGLMDAAAYDAFCAEEG